MTRARLVWIAVPLLLLAFDLARLQVRDSITDFLPGSGGTELVAIAAELAETKLARGMVLCIGRPGDLPGALAVAGELAAGLAEHPGVAWVTAGAEGDEFEDLLQLYLPRRSYFVSERPEAELSRLLRDEALRRRARELRRALASPVPSLSARLASRDPLGIVASVVARVGQLRSGVSLEADRFVAPAVPGDPAGIETWAVVFLESRASPFEAARQAPLLRAIDARFGQLSAKRGGGFVLERSGAHAIAAATERSMRRDLRFITGVSLAGVVGLLLFALRSLRSLLLVLYPVVVGVLFALACGLAAFGSVHLVTLAFSASLTGIAVDYSIHLLDHHALAPARGGARATLRRLRPALVLGAATTLAGFVGFLLASFPGVREMGILAVAGVTAALVATLFGLPHLLPDRVEPTPVQASLAAALERIAGRASKLGARAALLAAAAAAALAAFGIPRIHWADDPEGLTANDPALVAEDARVRRRVSSLDGDRFVAALAPDRDAAVALNDRVWERLAPLVESGELAGMHSLHQLLWSRELQLRNLAALQAQQHLAARVDRAFASEGFRAGSLRPEIESLRQPEAEPLRFADLEGSALARLAAPLLVDRAQGAAALTYLRGARGPAPVRRALAGLDEVHLVDRQLLYGELFAAYRRGALRLIGLGSLAVVALLFARYRSLRATLAAALPAAVAITGELGIFGLLGIPVNLMGTMSLLLILGLGVDYGIFVGDAHGEEHLGATLLSLLLSCATTIFVFGVLALSSHPALRGIGLTSGIGVLLAFLAAPASAALLAERPAAEPAA